MATPWNEEDRKNWFHDQQIKRSYEDEVLKKIRELSKKYKCHKYGSLPIDPKRYPLFLFEIVSSSQLPYILITGGVHGYETSGVQGALRFLETKIDQYIDQFNFVVAPCISPWGYETINRWNPSAVDPNRNFFSGGKSEECHQLMNKVNSFGYDFLAHLDLHETTDTDNTVFRPALAQRDGIEQDQWEIPDGFYLVGDTENPCDAFQKAIIDSVRQVTHIAPSDDEGRIIGEKTTQEGVINYPIDKVHLCTSFSKAKYNTTTEVYPDSPRVNDEQCTQAQVAAIVGALNFLK